MSAIVQTSDYEKRPEINGFRVMWQILFVFIIIAFVAAVLFPVYTGNSGPSRKSACMSNQKQIVLSCLMYAADNDDRTPLDYTFDSRGKQFMDAIYPYSKNKQIFICPVITKNTKDGKIKVNLEGIPDVLNYVHSLSLRGIIPNFKDGNRELVLSSFANPAQIAWMRDAIEGYGVVPGRSSPSYVSAHGAGFVLSYIDGHAKTKTPIDEVKEL